MIRYSRIYLVCKSHRGIVAGLSTVRTRRYGPNTLPRLFQHVCNQVRYLLTLHFAVLIGENAVRPITKTPILGELFFILSMGHRIHFISYDPTVKNVKISKLLSNIVLQGSDGTTKGIEANYTYESWTHQLLDYQTVYQVFCQYPTPEYHWNALDHVVTFLMDLDSSEDSILAIKPKRLRFSLIPELISDADADEEAAYFAKFEKLVQYLKSKARNKNLLDIKVDKAKNPGEDIAAAVPTTQSNNIKHTTNIIRLWLPSPAQESTNWITLRYDNSASIHRVYHLEVHWVACEAFLVDEFVNTLFIRCRNWQLRLVQIPEYFVTANLNIHPYRSQPFFSLQSSLPSVVKSKYAPLVNFIESDYFVGQPNEWLEDNKQLTNWSELGLNDPKTELRDKEVRVNVTDGGSMQNVQLGSNDNMAPTSAAVGDALAELDDKLASDASSQKDAKETATRATPEKLETLSPNSEAMAPAAVTSLTSKSPPVSEVVSPRGTFIPSGKEPGMKSHLPKPRGGSTAHTDSITVHSEGIASEPKKSALSQNIEAINAAKSTVISASAQDLTIARIPSVSLFVFRYSSYL
jgi:hypothetical protein